MTIADGSQVRLADVAEVTIGTTPSTPAFQVRRYVTSDVKISKQTLVPNEVRADRNVSSITDVGRNVQGTINTELSYGTFDDWLSMLLCADWSTDVLKNGITPKTRTLEFFYEQGATDTYVRYQGSRMNTLDLNLTARQTVTANWGIMGIRSPTPTTAIITGATYAPATTTPVFNAGLNVASLALTGVSNSPKMRSLTMRINNNIYQNDVVGSYEPYSHGFGRFEVTGTMTTYFENLDTYNAILNHSDIALAFQLADALGNTYDVEIPKLKLLDGGPPGVGNGQPVIMDVPYQAFFDSSSSASITITRNPA
ncbi:phage tail tube protein [Rhizobium sp. SGZ-381]|uniref:phage tail tube protein n=1 Tax=Rhizobium sp. SGZ-381 TaxID=3342800 RepID=UPI00366E94AA